MIEFQGELSEQSLQYLGRQVSRRLFFAMLIFSPIALGLMAVLGSAINAVWLALCVTVAVLVLVGVVLWFVPQKNVAKQGAAKAVVIEENKIVCELPDIVQSHGLDEVKEIVDTGNAYAFKFYGAPMHIYFFCQKDLITKGSIEQFEAIFKDKIVRRNKA